MRWMRLVVNRDGGRAVADDSLERCQLVKACGRGDSAAPSSPGVASIESSRPSDCESAAIADRESKSTVVNSGVVRMDDLRVLPSDESENRERVELEFGVFAPAFGRRVGSARNCASGNLEGCNCGESSDSLDG